MVTMTIRNLDDEVKSRLRVRAARHGRSMEEEARSILKAAALAQGTPPTTDAALAQAIRARVQRVSGVDLELPPRTPMPEPPVFTTSAPDAET